MATYFVDTVLIEKTRETEFSQSKIERLKQVRQQELLLSRQLTKENARIQEENRKAQEIQEKFNEYQRKLREIEELTRLKSQNLKEIGLAQKAAELSKLENERLRKENEERRQSLERKAKTRGKQALEFFSREAGEKSTEKNEILRIKKAIKDQESELARQNAEEYRKTQKDKPEEPPAVFTDLKLENNLAKKKKRLDFKNTHFHNPLIQRHSFEDQKENAMELANKEYEKNMSLLKERTMSMAKSQEVAQERGNRALKEKRNGAKMEEFERSLERLQKEENKRKVEEDRRLKVPVIEKTVKNLTAEKREEKDLETVFLQRFAMSPSLIKGFAS